MDIKIEKLPDGSFLATSSTIQGLVVQGKTMEETIAIAKDVTKKLYEAKSQRENIGS